ncbi:MAG: hypothetical protein KY476_11950 [Planctomycetes bacterium]|nr:hypothetical protein [Planctomycetota bacterium]
METQVDCPFCGTVNRFVALTSETIGECCECGQTLVVPNQRRAKYIQKQQRKETRANRALYILFGGIAVIAVLSLSAILLVVYLSPTRVPKDLARKAMREHLGMLADLYSIKVFVTGFGENEWFASVFADTDEPLLMDKHWEIIIGRDGSYEHATKEEWEKRQSKRGPPLDE